MPLAQGFTPGAGANGISSSFLRDHPAQTATHRDTRPDQPAGNPL